MLRFGRTERLMVDGWFMERVVDGFVLLLGRLLRWELFERKVFAHFVVAHFVLLRRRVVCARRILEG